MFSILFFHVVRGEKEIGWLTNGCSQLYSDDGSSAIMPFMYRSGVHSEYLFEAAFPPSSLIRCVVLKRICMFHFITEVQSWIVACCAWHGIHNPYSHIEIGDEAFPNNDANKAILIHAQASVSFTHAKTQCRPLFCIMVLTIHFWMTLKYGNHVNIRYAFEVQHSCLLVKGSFCHICCITQCNMARPATILIRLLD